MDVLKIASTSNKFAEKIIGKSNDDILKLEQSLRLTAIWLTLAGYLAVGCGLLALYNSYIYPEVQVSLLLFFVVMYVAALVLACRQKDCSILINKLTLLSETESGCEEFVDLMNKSHGIVSWRNIVVNTRGELRVIDLDIAREIKIAEDKNDHIDRKTLACKEAHGITYAV